MRPSTMLRLTTIACCLLTLGLVACQTTPVPETGAVPDTVSPAALFSDNMVLQRGKPIPVWGWAPVGTLVTVTLDGEAAEAEADEHGRWEALLAPREAGGPYSMTINDLSYENVMIGEVWLCSGQSNMFWPVHGVKYGSANGPEEVAAANHPNIRLFTVPTTRSFTPVNDIVGADWKVCSPETVPEFSAVGYFFGRHLHKELDVPIGLIHSSWGGTILEAWMSVNTASRFESFLDELKLMSQGQDALLDAQREYTIALHEWSKGLPTHDAGTAGHWEARDLDDSKWETIPVPGTWEDAGFSSLDGYMWYRKTITIPEAWAGKDLSLSLGAINDWDITWFNGQRIGAHEEEDYANTARVYSVPGALVKVGDNIIAVRVFDVGNVGGLWGREPDLSLAPADGSADAISLAGVWKARPGLDLKDWPRPTAPPAALDSPNVPTVLFNGMIAPLVPYAIAGAIWYQGESNAARAHQYRQLLPALIRDWRTHWGQGDFPLLIVQLANFMKAVDEPGESEWAELREAQLQTLSVDNTGLAVTIDIGDPDNIHPKNKQEVGRRLGLAAEAIAYGEEVVYSGPIFRSLVVSGDKAFVHFEHVGEGLKTSDGEAPRQFEIAGEDRQFVWGQAKIEGDTVVVWHPDIPAPRAVRYGWANNPVCTLYNQAGLPASPFRSDDWPGLTVGKE